MSRIQTSIFRHRFAVGLAVALPAFSAIPAIAAGDDITAPPPELTGEAARLYGMLRGWPIQGITAEGREWHLDAVRNGLGEYIATDNVDAARTIRIDQVWNGGSSGLDLTGAGVTVGIWDGGRIRADHVQFSGRVTVIDNVSLSSHATHVAGTIGSAGLPIPLLQPPGALSRGAASAVSILSYSSSGDTTEMRAEAGSGLRLSNHSYGPLQGWELGDWSGINGWHWFGNTSISSSEDYLFGFYSSSARSWDDIAYDNPRFLMIGSAGNHRTDDGAPAGLIPHWVRNSSGDWVQSTAFRQADGAGECLSGKACAKNVLVVGAVDDVGSYSSPLSVFLASFSSVGPTDDLRVKPDVVANGVELFSTDSASTQAYDTKSGTSMSTPNATGGAALLLQHYRETHTGADPLSSTLRGLLIATTDECGLADGPDANYGWGLLNIRRAADTITADASMPYTISEQTLHNGETQDFYAFGTSGQTLRVTACWTDPMGPSLSPALNPTTRVLVNDIDVRVTRLSNGTIYYPWELVGATLATQTDNNRDNVEKIELSGANTLYRIRVTHKGTLSGSQQAYSLIITGASGSGLFDDCNNNGNPDELDVGFPGMDCNGNQVLDVCETIDDGDFNADGVVSQSDFRQYLASATTANQPPTDPAFCPGFLGRVFDADNDFDIDLRDFGAFQARMNASQP